MWREILDYGRQLFALTETTQQNSEDIEKLQQGFDELSETVSQLVMIMQHENTSIRQEIQHLRETERQARENEILRIENALLRAGRQLPPDTEN